MGSLVSSSSEDFDQWAFAIDRRRHVPHGKTDLLSDSSVRSDGSALTMLLCSASGISVTYWCRTRNTTTRSVRIYPWRRIRRSRAPSSGPGTFLAAQFLAGCTTNISGFDLRQAQHLRQILQSYARYYNDIRTHRSLDKDAPVSRQIQRIGSIKSHAILGGLD